MKKLYIVFFIFLIAFSGKTQVVYEDINNTGIYEFLDELANLRIIEINSVVKPYSREYIARKLREARELTNSPTHKLNLRQKKELMFYLQDYQLEGKKIPFSFDHKLGFIAKNTPSMKVALNPLGFHYKDSLFTFSVRPIIGLSYMFNENGNMYHRYWGGSFFAYIGKNFGMYGSLRDNSESELMSLPEYLTRETGGVYKVNEGGRKGGDFSEARGGITVAWKWGSFGLMKDFFTWGNNYHGANIFSGHAPSFPYIQLHLNPAKWFDFNYIHGWLSCKVIDSTRSYWAGDVYRVVYHNKFIAANMFTVIPWKRLNISFGNSIIYSSDNINPAFLIPFLFFKSVDHSTYFNNDAGSNAQMFFDISSRQINHLNLYVTLFIDEFMLSRVFKKDENNFTSWKFGFRLSDFPIQNLSLTGEYTRTQPLTYKHYISTTTFTSNNFNMGHYMRDNSQEIYVALAWKPIRGLYLNTSYTLAEHGADIEYTSALGADYDKIPFLKDKTWQNYQFEFMARYELMNNAYVWLQYQNTNRKGDVKYGPEIYLGKTNTLIMGINVGF